MNQLPQECIEAIREYTNKQGNLNRRYGCTLGATEALTNPSIYEKAGLISLKEAADFYNWANLKGWYTNGVNWWNDANHTAKPTTTAQLFQIYQEQKEK